MKKISVGILGATGIVGQKFAELLSSHPWFEVTALAASDRSLGKRYQEAMYWLMPTPLSPKIGQMPLLPCTPNLPCEIVFSGLDSQVAGPIEENFAHAGYAVISNAPNHRMDPDVPLLIPEVNPHHLKLLERQPFGKGILVTNPNCSVIGITMALKPLFDLWGLEAVHVVTLQALSGAGYPGVASIDSVDNVIPFIANEEQKIETEPLKILGDLQGDRIALCCLPISAHSTRVPISEGHMACISVKLKQKALKEELITAWKEFTKEPQHLKLPLSPQHPLLYLEDERHPQPRLHRSLEKGMAISIGRLRKCPLFDWKFVILSHNTIRGGAGGAILNAELLVSQGFFAPHFCEETLTFS